MRKSEQWTITIEQEQLLCTYEGKCCSWHKYLNIILLPISIYTKGFKVLSNSFYSIAKVQNSALPTGQNPMSTTFQKSEAIKDYRHIKMIHLFFNRYELRRKLIRMFPI